MVPTGTPKSNPRPSSRLTFVLFALLLLILVPVLTSVLLHIEQRQLLEATGQARARLLALRNMTDGQHASPGIRRSEQELDAAVVSLSRQESQVQQHSQMLRTLQFSLTFTLGLLGLLACWYTHRALLLMRQNMSELDAQNRKLESLFDTASHLSVSLPESMHGYLTTRVASILPAAKAAIWRYDHQDRSLRPLLPACGFEPGALEDVCMPVCQGGWEHTLLFKDQAAITADLTAEPANESFRELSRTLKVRHMLAAPLIAHGKPVGILCAYDKPQQTFTEDDARLLRIFAGQTAFVLHSADLYARSLARSEQIVTLAHITAALNTSLELEDMLAVFAREACALIPFERLRLALVPPKTEGLGWSVAEQKYDPETDLAAEEQAETALTRRIRGRQAQSAGRGTAPPDPARPLGAEKTAQKGEVRTGDKEPWLTVWSVSKEAVIREQTLDPARAGLLNAAIQKRKPLLVSDKASDASPQPEAAPPTAPGRPAETRAEGAGTGIQEQKQEQKQEPKKEAEAELPAAGKGEPKGHIPRQLDYDWPPAASAIVVPLIVQNCVLGALELGSELPGAFHKTHLVLAQQLSGQLAAAVQNARLYEEARQRADQLEWGMQETHHRIKNNLQTVSAILDLHLMEAGANISTDALRDALQQVRTIATVHDLLSEDVRGGHVPIRRLLEALAPMLVSDRSAGGKQVSLHIDAEDYPIPSRIASALALTANELILNAMRHGGQGRQEVAIDVALHLQPGELRLTVRDDGPGFPQDYSEQAANTGLSLVQTLVERDHGGRLEIGRGPGAEVIATIPYAAS